MVGRVVVELVADGSYRLVEQDGELCHRWLPWEEPDRVPLDRGGFETFGDAVGFALAIDLIRAEHGMISETPAAIEKERAELDERPNAYGARRGSEEDATTKATRRADAALDRVLARIDAKLADSSGSGASTAQRRRALAGDRATGARGRLSPQAR